MVELLIPIHCSHGSWVSIAIRASDCWFGARGLFWVWIGAIALGVMPVRGTYAADDLAAILARANLAGIGASQGEWEIAAESLRLVDALEPTGRHRFLMPDVRARGKVGATRLATLLQQSEIFDDVNNYLNARSADARMRMDAAAARGDREAAYRWKWRAEGLASLLNPAAAPSGGWPQAQPWNSIRVTRSSVNFPLVTWNAGSFSVAKSANFSIASQAGERPTAEMAELCEIAFAVWKQMFFRFWANEQVDAPEFTQPSREPFRVVLFRNREAYVKALRTIEPRIGISTGYYSPQHRISFFYWDGTKSIPTLVHELTHQFFNEAAGQSPAFDPDRDPGFWVVEGVALYMESFSSRPVGGAKLVDIGGWDALRLQAGKYRRLHDEYWIPWEEFHAAGGNAVRSADELPAWYSQACGLAHRWLDGSPEERERFASYLQGVYAGQGAEVMQVLGKNDDEARNAYDRYLLRGWKDELSSSGGRIYFPNRSDVVMSRCEVTSSDLLAWPKAGRKVQWLDLSHTPIDDDWLLQAGEPAWEVTRLNLESTAITDASLPVIAKMESLTELDLTGCQVTDAGIRELSQHPNLRQLWLGDTQITDASIDTLESLKRLDRVVVSGSQVSDAGWQRLLRKKPHLRK